jgi:hypothetical protein
MLDGGLGCYQYFGIRPLWKGPGSPRNRKGGYPLSGLPFFHLGWRVEMAPMVCLDMESCSAVIHAVVVHGPHQRG